MLMKYKKINIQNKIQCESFYGNFKLNHIIVYILTKQMMNCSREIIPMFISEKELVKNICNQSDSESCIF